MTHCYVDCQIEGVKSVGGIIGYYQCHGSAGRIQNSLTEGTVTGNLSAGGLIGDFYINSTEEAPVVVMLQNNENRAAISGEGDVGGLIGYVNSSYHHYTYTRIEYSQTYYGQTYGVTVHVYPRRTPDIVNCMNIGIVSGLSENSNIGGIVGRFGGTTYNNENAIIEKCYNVGVVEGSGKKGALTSGGNGYTVNGSNVYYLDDCISNATENSGIMKSEDQLRKESTYEFWDFENVWLIDKEADYRFPMLRGVSDVAEIEVPSNCQHKNTSIQNNSDATCTEAGYTGDIVCLDCGLTMEVGMTIPAIGHAPKTYTTPSTCAENGFTITICTRCGETLSKEILPRLDHTWTSEVTQNPTCTAQGVKTYTCESCGETYTEPVDVLAHQWDDGKMTKAPSCTEAGEMTYTCATGGETRTEPIDKLEHEIVLVAGKAASCTEPGLTDGWQCKMCKKWFAEQQTIPALSHDPQIGKVVEPTCIDPGYTPFICTRCGETVSKTDPTDALGHDMQPTYVWAKDDSTVTATMACTRCDKTGATETAKVQNEVTVKPTCSTEGELTLTAAFNNKSFYGQTKTKTLPRDPDAHVFKVTVTPPTCIDEGYTSHMCTLCRYGYSDEIVPALGHKPVTDEAVPATCEAPGLTEGSHCSVCGEVLTAQEETPVLDHADADNDGQCDTCGNQMTGDGYCKYCGKVHTGAFGWLIQFFHNILAIFKR